MRLLVTFLAALVVSVAVALAAREDPGYVLFSRGGWTVETTLALFVVALILLFGVLYALLRTLVNTRALPRRLAQWRQRRQELKARRATHRGLIELAEGHWERAERLLNRGAQKADVPLLNYLGAARAAQKQGEDDRRDHYLSLAHQAMPEAELAVGITQAEVQLSHGQYEQALATLVHLQRLAPKNAHVLHLLKRLYERLESWQDLAELLPNLRKHKVEPQAELDRMEGRIHQALLQKAGEEGDVEELRRTWVRIPKELREQPEMLAHYVHHLQRLGREGDAERLLREELRRRWEPRLAELYGRVAGDDPARQLDWVETWIKEQGERPELLLSAGRLALRSQLWGKARAYLEQVAEVAPAPGVLQELGALLEELGEPGAAADCYRRGLSLATGEERALPPPA
ncbi:MAG TPA: heme biosynthesis protein HemY [Gammaproteobacteria bacterium]|nr:heme biosynthesis protein HemY [Gammaproteobacteria bacterium]